ncbi:MAG TPA: hypothetical protein VK470_08025 [Bacteroidota bacterium]|nr:hypothetical protein [Bacteroidota bacterium]
MDSKIDTANLQPLSLLELIQLEGGGMIPWGPVLISVGVSAFTNLPDILRGIADGWKAAR